MYGKKGTIEETDVVESSFFVSHENILYSKYSDGDSAENDQGRAQSRTRLGRIRP